MTNIDVNIMMSFLYDGWKIFYHFGVFVLVDDSRNGGIKIIGVFNDCDFGIIKT